MPRFSFLRLVLSVAALATAGCATATREPPNIQPLKMKIRAYVDSGDYQRDIVAVAARARTWVEDRAAKGGEKLTVVLDFDETLISNWPLISAQDFGFVVREWNRWVEEAKAPAIESVRDVYRAARRRGVNVIVVTGRAESVRAGTERNLRAIDCVDYAELICKPDDQKGTSAAFKTAVRKKLAAAGWTIIANIGDQDSDLVGGYAEQTFKLPSPFYLTE